MATRCNLEGCEHRSKAKGLCSKHYSWATYHSDKVSQRERARKRNRTLSGKFHILKHNAKNRGIQMLLTPAEYAVLIKSPCYYCNGNLPVAGGGLDRIDPNIGYVLSNVRACCSVCNTMKSNLSEQDLYTHIKKIMKNRGIA